MFKKTVIFILCALLAMITVFNVSEAGRNHNNSDPLYHTDLTAESSYKQTGLISFTYTVKAKVTAPFNADGDYEVLAWVKGDVSEHHKNGYLGGVTANALSVVKKGWFDVPPHPEYRKTAVITGKFLLGSPCHVIIHTQDPLDHLTADDR